jgi:acetate kinase
MDEYALVLNAGSSSLKFCVFHRPDKVTWYIASRGQIDGIGTIPRLKAKTDEDALLADQTFDRSEIKDGSDAIEALAGWLRSMYGGSKVLGVGHRVVHGGAR